MCQAREQELNSAILLQQLISELSLYILPLQGKIIKKEDTWAQILNHTSAAASLIKKKRPRLGKLLSE